MLLWHLLPGICALCGAATRRAMDLCAACEADLPRNAGACSRCALPTPALGGECPACLVAPPPCSRTIAPFAYALPMTRLIHGLKRGNGLLEARILAALIAPAALAEPLPDAIVPMPLTWRRRMRRGYNQAALLAAQLAKRVGVAVRYDALKRIRHTPPQQSLDAAARRRSLRGAFQAAPAVTELSVALVDDVLTTGATTNEATQALLDAGAADVRVWAAARTPLP